MTMSKKIGFIPLRKGSKGIKNKNKKKIAGRPLFSWVLAEALFSSLDEIYVYTDDIEIIDYIKAEYHWTSKIKVLMRSEESATDVASTETAMLEFCKREEIDFDVFCLLQATSPMTKASDIDACLDKIEKENFTSALTAVKTHRFIWNADGTAQNYDVFKRPRRQDFEGILIENGAVYATTKKALLESNNRISGSVGIVEMPEETLVEIDSITDWTILETLLFERQKKDKKPNRINHLVLDVDGVFTDGCVYYDSEGEMAKKFNMRDGMGLEIIRQHDVKVIVITSENSELVKQRMKKLKIDTAFFGVKDKYAFLLNFAKENAISFNNIAYCGDDVNDLANICAAGWSFAPQDAVLEVKQHVDVILACKSAEGAIRELCEFILKYNKRYE